jgi:hypothetical protein
VTASSTASRRRETPASIFLREVRPWSGIARYCIMLAEQAEDPELRDHLLRLVRAWLAAAKEAESADG